MIILESTDKLQVDLLSAVLSNQLECYASYRDTTSNSISPGSTASVTNGVNAIDLISSPPSSTQRVIDYISVYNSDLTTATVRIQLDIGGTSYILIESTLFAGEKLEYQEGAGFRSLGHDGELKQANAAGYNNVTGIDSAVLSTDVTNANVVANTIADITGLSFSVSAGSTYWFRFVIPYVVNNNGNGSRFSVNGPTASALYYSSSYSTNTGAFQLNEGLSSYNLPAAANLTSTVAANTAIVEGIAVLSASGSIVGRFAGEGAGPTFSLTAKSGAVVYYKQLV